MYPKKLHTAVLAASLLLTCQTGESAEKKEQRATNLVSSETIQAEIASDQESETEGYRAVCCFGNDFLAAGTNGRVDWISASGKILKTEKLSGFTLKCALSFDDIVMVGGEKGELYVSRNNAGFKKVSLPITDAINSLASFNGKIVAGADFGQILLGDQNGKFEKIQLALKGNITSVSANATVCYGVTDEGEIISSKNGKEWTKLDFNQLYEGYYKTAHFTSVFATDSRIAVAGKNDDDTPVLMFSSEGSVWAERSLNYNDENGAAYLKEIPEAIFYNEQKDEFVLACQKGKVMTIPSCSHCNQFYPLASDDIRAVTGNGTKFIFAGDKFYFKVAVNE